MVRHFSYNKSVSTTLNISSAKELFNNLSLSKMGIYISADCHIQDQCNLELQLILIGGNYANDCYLITNDTHTCLCILQCSEKLYIITEIYFHINTFKSRTTNSKRVILERQTVFNTIRTS